MTPTVAGLNEAVLNNRDIERRSGIRTRWWWPEPALAGCLRACIARDTTGVPMTMAEGPGAAIPAPVFSRFPATPACSLAWFLEGAGTHRSDGQPLPARIVFRGPFSRPALAQDAAGLHVFLVMLLPDALSRLTGVRPLDHLDQLSPAQDVFGADWAPLFAEVAAAADDDERVRRVTSFLMPRWQQASHASPLAAHNESYHAWSLRLAHQAGRGEGRRGSKRDGRSARQRERRLRAWTGQSAGGLRRIARAERCFRLLLQACVAERAARPNWAELALAAGYADQPHLCREVRSIAGVSPQALWRGMRDDPSFWIFRLWQGADAASGQGTIAPWP